MCGLRHAVSWRRQGRCLRLHRSWGHILILDAGRPSECAHAIFYFHLTASTLAAARHLDAVAQRTSDATSGRRGETSSKAASGGGPAVRCVPPPCSGRGSQPYGRQPRGTATAHSEFPAHRLSGAQDPTASSSVSASAVTCLCCDASRRAPALPASVLPAVRLLRRFCADWSSPGPVESHPVGNIQATGDHGSLSLTASPHAPPKMPALWGYACGRC